MTNKEKLITELNHLLTNFSYNKLKDIKFVLKTKQIRFTKTDKNIKKINEKLYIKSDNIDDHMLKRKYKINEYKQLIDKLTKKLKVLELIYKNKKYTGLDYVTLMLDNKRQRINIATQLKTLKFELKILNK